MLNRMILLAPVLLAAPLAAQFEGVVSARMNGGRDMGGPAELTIYLKGSKQAVVMKMPTGTPMAGQDVRIVNDAAAATSTILAPTPPQMAAMVGNARGVKIVVNHADVADNAKEAEKVEMKKLGTTQRIAGRPCDDYELSTDDGKANLCLAKGLGSFLLLDPGMGGRPGRGTMPAWARAVVDQEMFPLKVWSGSTVAFEVTAIEQRSVPGAMLMIPSDYMDMSAMMGGMGRRP